MGFIADPILNPQIWDYCVVGGEVCPGICEVSGFDRVTGWDVKQGKGTKGATLTLSTLPPAEGSIKFFLWTDDHFIAWKTFRNKFKYDPTKKSVQAVDIFYPSLAEIDIASVVTKKIGATVHEGKQLYSVTVDLLEYLPPPKKTATGTPTGSNSDKNKAGKSGSSGDPIADAQQREIARLQAIASAP